MCLAIELLMGGILCLKIVLPAFTLNAGAVLAQKFWGKGGIAPISPFITEFIFSETEKTNFM